MPLIRGEVMARKSATSIKINPNARCARIYPVENTPKSMKDLQTVGLKLSKDKPFI